MKEKTDDISVYSKLTEAAGFYINESFHYINRVMEGHLANILFQEKLMAIDPSEEDRNIISKLALPDDAVELLRCDADPLSDTTTQKMSLAWSKAQLEARLKSHKFKRNFNCEDIEILGHINNLAFLIEAITHRHLLFLKQTGEIDDYSYKQIESANILKILVFILRDKLKDGQIKLNLIEKLFSLRNKTVHYTPDNSQKIAIQLNTMLDIWGQVKELFVIYEKEEKFVETPFSSFIDDYHTRFEKRWL